MSSPRATLAALYKARGLDHPDLDGVGDVAADDREAQRVLRVLREATPAALAFVALDLVQEQGCDDKGGSLVKPNERLAAAKFALDCYREIAADVEKSA